MSRVLAKVICSEFKLCLSKDMEIFKTKFFLLGCNLDLKVPNQFKDTGLLLHST